MDTKNLWELAASDLEIQLGKAAFQTFLSQLKLLSLNNQKAVIGCGQPMLINLIEKRYGKIIEKTLSSYTENEVRLKFKAFPAEQKRESFKEPLFTVKLSSHPRNTISARLNSGYTFENFAVSSTNQMAYAAATAITKSPGTTYNPLFLYGGVGVGKTHLMQAVAHKLLKNRPKISLIYCTGEDFTNEIIEAIRNKTTSKFKKKYRRLKAFFIDDIQFIAGKNAVQEEFFHTFNTLQQTRGQVVLTSDKPPEEIKKLEERLRSRFEGGLTIDIGQPDFELRTAIVLIKAKQRGVDLPIEIAKLLASNIKNPRRLEGIFIRILTEARIKNTPIDKELTQKVLGKTIKEAPKKTLRPEKVGQAVASYFNIKLSQLKGKKRDRVYSLPRQVLYYLLRTELKIPLEQIGGFLGGRDHTTILHGVRKVNSLLSRDKRVGEDIMGIKQKLFG